MSHFFHSFQNYSFCLLSIEQNSKKLLSLVLSKVIVINHLTTSSLSGLLHIFFIIFHQINILQKACQFYESRGTTTITLKSFREYGLKQKIFFWHLKKRVFHCSTLQHCYNFATTLLQNFQKLDTFREEGVV